MTDPEGTGALQGKRKRLVVVAQRRSGTVASLSHDRQHWADFDRVKLQPVDCQLCLKLNGRFESGRYDGCGSICVICGSLRSVMSRSSGREVFQLRPDFALCYPDCVPRAVDRRDQAR
jgi:hypothetical protein